jgi:membrane protein involved in colicin uptake
MSKEAALRAMREARYAERTAKAGAVTKPARAAVRPAAKKTSPAEPVAPAGATDDLCGHRSMNGRTCTRERGHSAKSHRYS